MCRIRACTLELGTHPEGGRQEMTPKKPEQRNDEDIKLDVVANLRWDGRV